MNGSGYIAYLLKEQLFPAVSTNLLKLAERFEGRTWRVAKHWADGDDSLRADFDEMGEVVPLLKEAGFPYGVCGLTGNGYVIMSRSVRDKIIAPLTLHRPSL